MYTATSLILLIITTEIGWAIAPQRNHLDRRDPGFNYNLWPFITFWNHKIWKISLPWQGYKFWCTGLLHWIDQGIVVSFPSKQIKNRSAKLLYMQQKLTRTQNSDPIDPACMAFLLWKVTTVEPLITDSLNSRSLCYSDSMPCTNCFYYLTSVLVTPNSSHSILRTTDNSLTDLQECSPLPAPPCILSIKDKCIAIISIIWTLCQLLAMCSVLLLEKELSRQFCSYSVETLLVMLLLVYSKK